MFCYLCCHFFFFSLVNLLGFGRDYADDDDVVSCGF